MRHRLLRFVAAVLSALAITGSVPAAGAGLTCVDHPDVERAAREALAGDHPLWANAYIVGRVERIDRAQHEPLVLTVVPSHVFVGEMADRLRLAARTDGPPDPNSWHVGGHYFLALASARGIEDVDALVAPCAPNFPILSGEQLDRLVDAAPGLDTRDAVLSLSPTAPPLGTVLAFGGGLGAIVFGWYAFRRRARDRSGGRTAR